jgi:hypothetical protein
MKLRPPELLESRAMMASMFENIASTAIEDVNNDGHEDIAVGYWRSDIDRSTLEIRSGSQGESLNQINLGSLRAPDEFFSYKTATGESRVAMLLKHSTTGEILLQVRDAATGQRLQQRKLTNPNQSVIDIEFINVASGSPRLAILSRTISNDSYRLQTFDIATGQRLSSVNLARGLQPFDLAVQGSHTNPTYVTIGRASPTSSTFRLRTIGTDGSIISRFNILRPSNQTFMNPLVISF